MNSYTLTNQTSTTKLPLPNGLSVEILGNYLGKNLSSTSEVFINTRRRRSFPMYIADITEDVADSAKELSISKLFLRSETEEFVQRASKNEARLTASCLAGTCIAPSYIFRETTPLGTCVLFVRFCSFDVEQYIFTGKREDHPQNFARFCQHYFALLASMHDHHYTHNALNDPASLTAVGQRPLLANLYRCKPSVDEKERLQDVRDLAEALLTILRVDGGEVFTALETINAIFGPELDQPTIQLCKALDLCLVSSTASEALEILSRIQY